jgi:hypothetical protein
MYGQGKAGIFWNIRSSDATVGLAVAKCISNYILSYCSTDVRWW